MAGTSEGMIAVAPDRTIRVINEAASAMLGVTRHEGVGAPVDRLGVSGLSQALHEAIDGQTSVISKCELEGKEFTFTVSPYVDGIAWGAVITIRDDSEILAVRRRSEAILTSTSDGLVIFSPEDRITFVNPAAEQMLGRGAETLVGLITDTWKLLDLAPIPRVSCATPAPRCGKCA